ncbi:MAG: hypothetical protein K2Y37_13765 [Pirellulales bacterium]|nr:hypothetical protein [Pirellulales bacterium]
MTYRGHIENGVVVFDEPVVLAEGTEVRVEPAEASTEANGPAQPTARAGAASEAEQKVPGQSHSTLYEHLKSVIGIVTDLPPDFAKQHDHYIHGTPRE